MITKKPVPAIFTKLFVFIALFFLISCSPGSSKKITIQPTTHNFGTVSTGDNSQFTFTITNNMTFEITLQTFAIQGANNNEFSFVSGNTPNTIVASKSNHVVIVGFVPQTVGTKSAKLEITNNWSQDTLESTLSGESIAAPFFNIDPDSHNFNLVLIGQNQDVTFTISNPGVLDLVITDIQIASTPPFSITAGWTGSAITITPSGSRTLTVRYAPQNVGANNGTITFTHNAPNSPTVVNIEGEGTTAVPQISIDPTTYDFGSVSVGSTSAPATFTISNPGNAQLNVTDITFTGTYAADFARVANLPMNIAPAGNSQFTATFTPSAAGAKNAVMTITHNAAGSPLNVNVTGTGTTGGTPRVLFSENFDVAAGWTVFSGPASAGFTWYIEDGTNVPNETGGSGNFANADSDLAASLYGAGITLDEYLISPEIDCSAITTGTITLEFKGNFQRYDGNSFDDFAAVLVWDGADYQIVDAYNVSWNPAGETKRYDVSVYALGNSEFDIVFYYTGEDDWFFQVDDVKVTHTP